MNEKFLTQKQRYKPVIIPDIFSDEEMAKDWTLSESDKIEINKYRINSRTFIAVQICAIRVYGRFLSEVLDLSPRVINYINLQLNLPPSLSIVTPDREATSSEQRKNILKYLGFKKFNLESEETLRQWIEVNARNGFLHKELFTRAEQYLMSNQVTLPGPSVLERLIISVCSQTHEKQFDDIFNMMSSELKNEIDKLLQVTYSNQRSPFYLLKEYPPSATVSSIKKYLERYKLLTGTGIDNFVINNIEPNFLEYLFQLGYFGTTPKKV